MKIHFKFLLSIFLSGCFTSISFSAVVSGSDFVPNRILIVNSNLPITPPDVKWSENPDFSQALDYYRRLNHLLVRKNPIEDAKNSLAKGQIIFLTALGSGFYKAAVLRNQLSRNGNPLNSRKPNTPIKLIQGSGFDPYSGGFPDNYPNQNRVLEVYAQSAARYAYYWNRTVAHHLKQEEVRKKALTTKRNGVERPVCGNVSGRN